MIGLPALGLGMPPAAGVVPVATAGAGGFRTESATSRISFALRSFSSRCAARCASSTALAAVSCRHLPTVAAVVKTQTGHPWPQADSTRVQNTSFTACITAHLQCGLVPLLLQLPHRPLHLARSVHHICSLHACHTSLHCACLIDDLVHATQPQQCHPRRKMSQQNPTESWPHRPTLANQFDNSSRRT